MIVDSFPHGISLKILNLFNGSESRDTIKVWDRGGPYNSCNDSLTDARAGYLGYVGDTIIIALPAIDSLKNSWDVIGDYVTPGFNCDEYKLRVENNTVVGLISGSIYCYYLNNCLYSYSYDSFLVDFPLKRLSCQTWLHSDELYQLKLFSISPNPASTTFTISIDESLLNSTATVTDITGRRIMAVQLATSNLQLATGNFTSGIYFVTVNTGTQSATRKLAVSK